LGLYQDVVKCEIYFLCGIVAMASVHNAGKLKFGAKKREKKGKKRF
jgi:hypothetical protein